MRIIGGNFKGKKILDPQDKKTRPLKDLTKESIFNVLIHSNKFSINIENFNKEKIKSISRDKGVDEKTISKIIQLIENCESAKYSRSSNSIMNNDLNNAREVINLILKNKQ